MGKTNYRGIDYSLGMANKDKTTGIRYGVINVNALSHWILSDAEPIYPETVEVECPECGKTWETDNLCPDDLQECPHCGKENHYRDLDLLEPMGWDYCPNDSTYTTEGGGEDGDIFVVKSPYKTRAQFCSPCAPGAVYLENPYDEGEWGYCFGLDMFDADSPCPYPIYDLAGNLLHAAGSYPKDGQ